jgi:predicted N-acetyltransferase YhbS
MLKQPFVINTEAPHQAPLVEALNERAFGPGRFAKTAHRLREGRAGLPQLSFVATDGDLLCGSVRYWPVTIGGAAALLLGPLAVDPDRQNQGIGKGLMEVSLAKAGALGHRLVILVGNLPYYARVGFAPVPHGQMRLPGPVDLARLLYVELVPGALADARGEVTAAGARIV